MKKLNDIRKKRAGVVAGFWKISGLIKLFALPFIIIAAVFWPPMQALAAEAAVSFGSESYSKENNEKFPIGVYIRGESKIGVYYVEVEYDTDRMRYTGGGDGEQDGVVILQGTGLRDEVKYMLYFQATGGGEAGIRIRYAEVREAVENGGEFFAVASLGSAPITIAGADESGVSFFDRIAEQSQGSEAGAAADEGQDSRNGGNEGSEGGSDGTEVGREGEEASEDEGNGSGGPPAGLYGFGTDIPILAAVDTGDGIPRYIVDHAGYIPDTASWDYRTVNGMCGEQPVTFLTNGEGTVRILYLMEEIFIDGIPIAENFMPYAYNSENGQLYRCQAAIREGETYLYMSPYACSEWPDELTLQAISEEHVFFAIDMEGKGDFYQVTQDNELVEWNLAGSRATVSAQARNLIYILLAAFAVMAVVSICAYRAVRGKAGDTAGKGMSGKRRANVKAVDAEGKGRKTGSTAEWEKGKRARKKWKREGLEEQEESGPRHRPEQDELQELELFDDRDSWGDEDDYDYEGCWEDEAEPYDVEPYDTERCDTDENEDWDGGVEGYDSDWSGDTADCTANGDMEAEAGEASGTAAEWEAPVISVRDVTMIFHISTGNASGIKEYLIQWIKHQVTFREMTALDHVSFDVFKGEVVGIIGTNGSGKSTLLRIVSGALNPTGGRVMVDRKKVQLLTLGTGFDMELSAKENVYLNGAIIGYSKEFLDAHYGEIVEFAELQDFMEEKVKNFSSGMVSRLGFAIATAGDAAEILILDEVLSVGDEFFRKKSLARIKEMIHGGSTVLMVSHSLGTILENCTKVVWIEKGKLMMVGEAKEVCEAYEGMRGAGR